MLVFGGKKTKRKLTELWQDWWRKDTNKENYKCKVEQNYRSVWNLKNIWILSKLYAHNLDKYLWKYSIFELMKGGGKIENFIPLKKMKAVIKNLSTRKTQGLDVLYIISTKLLKNKFFLFYTNSFKY